MWVTTLACIARGNTWESLAWSTHEGHALRAQHPSSLRLDASSGSVRENAIACKAKLVIARQQGMHH